jgi:hypothetical protein
MNEKDWKLDGNQVRELRVTLESAFTSEADLKQLVRENLNETLQTIAKGENVRKLISSLLEWAESTGRVRELVIAAAYERCGNLNIQRFIENNIHNLIEVDNDKLSSDLVVSLIKVINQASDFDVIWQIGKNILPSTITVARPQEIQVFEQPKLSNWFKCFRLLKLLLEDYPLLNQRSSILILVEHLLKEESVDSSIKQQLKEWLHKIDPNFNSQPSGSEQVSCASSQPASGALQAYLMITVNPEKSKTKVRAIASLLCISPTGTRKEIPVHLNQQSNERGVLCTWNELSDKIEDFVKESLSYVLKIPQNLLGCAYYDMTIELFFPVDYLCKPVDRWKIKDSYGDKVYLGSRYRLVVRSYDRVKNDELKNALSKSWHRAKDLLRQNPKPELLQANIQHIDSINCAKLGLLREQLSEKIGTKITCPLPGSQKEMIRFFKKLLDSGVPIAFWTRSRELCSNEVIRKIDQFLTLELLLNSCNLLEKVRKERALAFEDCEIPEQHWGSHLSVLWDDYDRMPTLESFQKGGQRSQ